MIEILTPSRTIKIRKARTCYGCLKKFEVGSTMIATSFAGHGRAYTIYECPICHEHMQTCKVCLENMDNEDAYEGCVLDCLKEEDPFYEANL